MSASVQACKGEQRCGVLSARFKKKNLPTKVGAQFFPSSITG